MDLKPIDQVREDYRLIKAHTNYELIEIEQTRPPSGRVVSRLQGFLAYKYKTRMDDTTDPENPTVSSINGRIDGDTIQFVENPFPGRKPVGTGKIAFILNDNLPADPEEFPDGYLSGAEKGYNLEVLATHYNEQLWKIIDPEIEKEVIKRSEAIQEKVSNQVNQHIFGNKYGQNKSGNGQEKEIKISVDQSNDELREMMKEMRQIIDAQAKEIAAMKKPKSPKKVTTMKPKEVKSEPAVVEPKVEKAPETVSNFAK